MDHISNHLPAQVSQELQKQEKAKLRDGDENRFLAALQNGTLANGGLEDVKQVLRYAMVKIGLRAANWPAEMDKAVLIDHVLKNYGTHTAEEMRLAFDLATTGKLDVDANCYENFSCLYFSNIMNAYRLWAGQTFKQHASEEKPRAVIDEVSLADESMSDWLEETRKRKQAVEFMPVQLYEWIVKTGRVELSNQQKHEYLQKAVMWRQHRLIQAHEAEMTKDNHATLVAFNRMKEAGEFTGPEVETLKTLAKKMILYNYLFDKV